jgi:quinoprotein glucose dehydrogenase
MMRFNLSVFTGAMVLFLRTPSGATQQSRATAGADWPMYRNDDAGTGYLRLTQIDTKNVANLSQAWIFSLQSDAPPAAAAARGRGGAGGVNSEATPIVVGGIMYLPAPNRVVVLESETGKDRAGLPKSWTPFRRRSRISRA